MLHIVRLINAQPITSRCNKPCIANVNKIIYFYMFVCASSFSTCMCICWILMRCRRWLICIWLGQSLPFWLKLFFEDACWLNVQPWLYVFVYAFVLFAFVIKVIIQFCRCQVLVSLNHCPSATLWQWFPCSSFACLIIFFFFFFFLFFFLCLLFSCFSRFPCFSLYKE